MRVLIAEDDFVSRRLLVRYLEKWGHEVVATENGAAAWSALQAEAAPGIAILDWMMPELDGVQVCQLVRSQSDRPYTYLILLTAKGGKEDIASGLNAGADDYVTKPFDPNELRARLQVGERMVELERALKARVRDLEAALTQVRQLEDLLPICSYCKRVRDDQDYWHQIESYLHTHTGADFTHGICPECFKKLTEEIDFRGAE